VPTWDISFDLRMGIDDPAVVKAVARVEGMAGLVCSIPLPPAAQQRIDRLNILRAVVGTTGIEGAELTEEEVGRIVDAPPGKTVLPPSRRREEMEGRNAERVMRYVGEALQQDGELPLTEQLICTLHKLTTEGIDYSHNEPGIYRSHRVTAGNYVPPEDREQMRRLMEEFVEWFNTGPPASWPASVQAIVAHFYVVSIHPFGDGNGRTARAVESFILYRGGINVRGFYSLANHYYRNRDRYIDLLDSTRFSGARDLTPFVLFGLEGLLAGLEEVRQAVVDEVRVITFRDLVREKLDHRKGISTKVSKRLRSLLYVLTAEPVSLADLSKGEHSLFRLYRGLSDKTATRDIRFLVSEGLAVVDDDELLRANLRLMDGYIPSPQLTQRSLRPRRSN
jgi:Fic family protein